MSTSEYSFENFCDYYSQYFREYSYEYLCEYLFLGVFNPLSYDANSTSAIILASTPMSTYSSEYLLHCILQWALPWVLTPACMYSIEYSSGHS